MGQVAYGNVPHAPPYYSLGVVCCCCVGIRDCVEGPKIVSVGKAGAQKVLALFFFFLVVVPTLPLLRQVDDSHSSDCFLLIWS
jgi:hypothetical protein